MNDAKKLCIYHGNCADGFGAAWVVRKALGANVEFAPGVYGQEPPDVTGKDVILVDFSYKYDVLAALANKANSIIVLDHHKSAAEDPARFEPFHAGIEEDTRQDDGPRLLGWKTAHAIARLQNGPAIACCFDMCRSGAMLAWDHFFPDQEPPQLLRHIEDRDLWLFKLDGTREIQANLFSYPYDFEVWDGLMAADVQTLRLDGAAIERKHHKDVGELVAVTKRRLVIGGHDVPAASLPYTLTSDAGHLMAQGEPFAACYWDTPTGRVFSLRSTDEGVDVSAIAKQYGGGGHRNAAGFRVPFDHALANPGAQPEAEVIPQQLSDNQTIDAVSRDEVERLVNLLRYQAHPYPSPHAEYWQGVLDKPADQHQGNAARWERLYHQASAVLCAIGEALGVDEDDQSTPDILEAVARLKTGQRQGGPAVSLELVYSDTTEGLHIRKWENVGGLTAGTHWLYRQAAECTAGPATSANTPSAADLAKFIDIVQGCYDLASSYAGCLDGVDEHGGDDHEDPTCAIFHRLYYAMFLVRKPTTESASDEQ